jgi:hypothetical protein
LRWAAQPTARLIDKLQGTLQLAMQRIKILGQVVFTLQERWLQAQAHQPLQGQIPQRRFGAGDLKGSFAEPLGIEDKPAAGRQHDRETGAFQHGALDSVCWKQEPEPDVTAIGTPQPGNISIRTIRRVCALHIGAQRHSIAHALPPFAPTGQVVIFQGFVNRQELKSKSSCGFLHGENVQGL